MDSQPKTKMDIIQEANKEMLDYFNKTFFEQLEEIQSLKTQVFEIDIKIEEYEKTRNIYAFKSSSKKSVFSPMNTDNIEDERSQIIDSQIKDLKDVKITSINKIKALELSINQLKKRLKTLNEASSAIEDFKETFPEEEIAGTSEAKEDFEFIEDDTATLESAHGYNILMQEAFNNTYLATLLDKRVKDGIASINHKLDMLSYLFTTDVPRAKLTIKEIKQSSEHILSALDDIHNYLDENIDTSKPIWSLLDDYIMQIREAHPECLVEVNIECNDYDINLHPIFTINLIKLLDIFFDNAFKHSNANCITFRAGISQNVIDVVIQDNGIGIASNYLEQSPWYSSLHKAHETIYLLNGSLDITGDLMGGTKIRFNFPVKG
ncbi:MAG: hypothetical protein ACI4D8_06700 [Wujia sp.]